MQLTRVVALARTTMAYTIGTVHVHTERYTCSQPLTHHVPHPLRVAHIRVQTSRVLPAAHRVCNLSETLVYRGEALGGSYQQHMTYRGPLPPPLLALKLLGVLTALTSGRWA